MLAQRRRPAFAVSAQEAMLQISEFDTGLALEAGFTRRGSASTALAAASDRKFRHQDGWLGVT